LSARETPVTDEEQQSWIVKLVKAKLSKEKGGSKLVDRPFVSPECHRASASPGLQLTRPRESQRLQVPFPSLRWLPVSSSTRSRSLCNTPVSSSSSCLDSEHLFKVFSKCVVPCSPSFSLLILFSSSTFNRILVHEGPLANFEIAFLDIVTNVMMSLSRLCGIYCFSPVRLFPIFPSFFLTFLSQRLTLTSCSPPGRTLKVYWDDNPCVCNSRVRTQEGAGQPESFELARQCVLPFFLSVCLQRTHSTPQQLSPLPRVDCQGRLRSNQLQLHPLLRHLLLGAHWQYHCSLLITILSRRAERRSPVIPGSHSFLTLSSRTR
jgi:hypothetical protein